MKMEYKNILPHFNNILQNPRSILSHFTDKNKIIPLASLIILLSSFNILFINNISSTSALSYQSTSKVKFNINPTVSITINGGDLSIPSLAPGDSKDSNIITVTASSNAMNGYSLSSTVGDSTNTSTELRKDSIDTTYKFSSISTNKPSLSDFDSNTNTWGYSYCNTSSDCTTNTNWISGDITITDPTSPLYPTTGYNGLPIYTTTSPITLINSPTSATSTIEFKIGARSTTTLVAGEYTNIINFISVASPNPVTFDDLFSAAGKTKYNGYYTMQDMNSTICSNAEIGYITQLIDIRDGEVYTISKLKDERCWLLDNLRLDPTNSITAANMNEDNTNAPAAAITNYLNGSQTAPEAGWSTAKVMAAPNETITNFNSYTDPRINNEYTNTTTTGYGRGSGLTGVYYNYCAATVGTYCYKWNEGVGNANYDMCPTNWKMPSGGSDGEYQNLCNVLYNNDCPNPTTMTISDINSLQYELSTPLSGFYYENRTGTRNSSGFFWSSTSFDTNRINYLYVVWTSISPQVYYERIYGIPVRCVTDN